MLNQAPDKSAPHATDHPTADHGRPRLHAELSAGRFDLAIGCRCLIVGSVMEAPPKSNGERDILVVVLHGDLRKPSSRASTCAKTK
jgi:hypothetical protein